MKHKNRNFRAKGFTLTELIIVIAIIGILAGILAPAMATYYRKSRIKDANADAKMIFNAVQTEAQSFISRDRGHEELSGGISPNDTNAKSLLSGDVLVLAYSGDDGTARYATMIDGFSWNSMTVIAQPPADPADPDTRAKVDRELWSIVEAVNKTVSNGENTSWSVCIQNYIVYGAVAADSLSTDRVGYYTAQKTQADDVTDHTYVEWLGVASDGDEVDSLADVCVVYQNALSTEETT